MGRKRVGRSVKKNQNVNIEPDQIVKAPHSFVIHKGLPGGHTVQLTRDFRRLMEPYTATSLKERKKNTIKDFVSIAGILHVSHICIFSRTQIGTYFKVARLPRGPTITFKVQDFSLSRDVISSLKKQLVIEKAFKHSPLIILNGFSGEGKHMQLMASMFQNMFPTINLTNVDLNNIRRCVLLNYDHTKNLIEFRHYVIKVTATGVNKGIKKMVQGKVPNLAKCDDIADFLTKSGFASDTEGEEDPSSHVTLTQKLASRGNMEHGKSTVKLSELGPRLTLQLMKIEEGLMDGKVLYHDFIEKSEEEVLEIQKMRAAKRKLKVKRKKVQEQNKKRKEDEKEQHKQRSLKGMQKGKSETDILMENATREDHNETPADDDAEYYREEVGEEPDKDLFTGATTGTRKPKTFHNFKKKAPRRIDKNSEDRKMSIKGKKPFRKGGKMGNSSQKPKSKFDKTNSERRDHRPIGGSQTKNKRKFKK